MWHVRGKTSQIITTQTFALLNRPTDTYTEILKTKKLLAICASILALVILADYLNTVVFTKV